ncbi:hypothetical protein RSAG8_13770, partial [Rhizoctonia solani AG-8 WAC10335]
MVPFHPVVKVKMFGARWGFHIYPSIAKSLVPLEIFSECIPIWQEPWESGIISRLHPRLEFCWKSLSKYSLVLDVSSPFNRHSVLSSLKVGATPSHGLDILRNSLSTFSRLRKFKLAFSNHQSHDLTSEFCETVPELCRFDVWQESCLTLEEVTLFGVTLKKA